jgi:formylglycine-generating enzyme required for sulfatase activity
MTSTPSANDVNDALLVSIAWYGYNSGPTLGSTSDRHVHQVAKKAPNSVGLYDVSGNLWEWCLDWNIAAGTAYTGGADGVCVVSSASGRLVRGGAWLSYPNYGSLGSRNYSNPNNLNRDVGCRLFRSPCFAQQSN